MAPGHSVILDDVIVPGREILRCEVGSTLHGIGIGSDDLDLMGVTVEPRHTITGLGRFEHFTWRTAGEGERSDPDDIDLVVYGLKKYVRLALTGNPTVVLPLYAPESYLAHSDKFGACELLETGMLSLPMVVDQAEYCKAIKRGDVTLDEALARAEELEQRAGAIESSPLPAEPDLDAVQSWMHSVYRRVHFDPAS